MATLPDVRGRGFATAVLDASVDHVAGEGGGELWCNARVPALGFYRRSGFEVEGDEFEIDGIGPHVGGHPHDRPAGRHRLNAGVPRHDKS